MQGAFRVGVLVTVGAALFLGVYWILGKSVFSSKTVTYYAQFADAGGITSGATVMMAGVQIGQVTKVELKGPDKALVTMAVDEGVQIPVGSTVELPTALIGIGDRQLNILPPAKGWTGSLAPRSILLGVKQSPFQSLLPDMNSTLAELNKTISAARRLIEDTPIKKNVESLLAATNKTVKQFGDLAARLDTTVAQNQANLRQLLTNGNKIMADIGLATGKLTAYVKSGKLEGQIDGLMAELDKTVKAGQKLVGDLNAIVADPELKESLSSVLANANKISESGTRLAANAEAMSKNGVEITDNAVQVSKKVNALADDAKDLFDRLKKAVEKLPKEIKFPTIEAEADVMRETHPDRWRTDLNMKVPAFGNEFYFGFYDAFESNKINLQLGKELGSSALLRYGVYAGKPGLGVDYRLAPRFSLRGDLFGANDTRFDVRARYDFGNGIFGWIGVDRIFRKNAPTIGVGFSK